MFFKKFKNYTLPKEFIIIFLVILIGFSLITKYQVLKYAFAIFVPWFFVPWFNSELIKRGLENKEVKKRIILSTMLFLSFVCLEISFFKGLSNFMFPCFFLGTLISIFIFSCVKTQKIKREHLKLLIPFWIIILLIPFIEVFIIFGKIFIK